MSPTAERGKFAKNVQSHVCGYILVCSYVRFPLELEVNLFIDEE